MGTRLPDRCDNIAAQPGAEAAKGWSADVARSVVELVASHKGVTDDADVCLLREVKLKFKSVGMGKICAREKAIAAIQDFLHPKAAPKSEDRSHLAKQFLRAAQAGALVEMGMLLSQHPSLLQARSSTKGYSAMHYAAMAGATQALDWLVQQGLAPDGLSSQVDESQPTTPEEVATEYKREGAAAHLRLLSEGVKFLKSVPAGHDDEARLRAASRAGSASAVRILLARDPALARRPAALAPTGALFSAASGGHTSVLRELIRCGGVELVKDGPSVLQAAVAAQQAEAANLLHEYHRAVEPLQVGNWTQLPACLTPLADRPRSPPLTALVVDAKLSRGRSVLVEVRKESC